MAEKTEPKQPDELDSSLWPKMSLSQLYKQRDLLTTKLAMTNTMLATVPSAIPIAEFLQKGLIVLNEFIAAKEKDRK